MTFRCRSCGSPRLWPFVDLGTMPSANAYRRPDAATPEVTCPLNAVVCQDCLLVQLDYDMAPADLFSDYFYFSSYSTSWVDHARRFAEAAIPRLALGPQSLVVEAASNDGYLLRHFVERGIPVLGVEPAANVAAVAVAAGVPTEVGFFGVAMADRLTAAGRAADLLVGNNVLAHVPDLNDFIGGVARLLKPEGVFSFEFPHLLRLMADVQFDTIYHEHFSYFSLRAVEAAFARHGLRVDDVEELPTHGGSLRLWGGSAARPAAMPAPGLAKVRADEAAARLDRRETYAAFGARVEACRRGLLDFLTRARQAGRRVAGYGAAAKGNTLLNYAGVGPDQIAFVVDRSPHKQGHLLPGSGIPVEAPEAVFREKPDYLLILPWNLKAEIMEQMAGIRDWGGRFVIAVPEIQEFA